MVVLGIAGLALAAASLLVACLAWRYPRAAPAPDPSPPVEQKGKDEGLAVAALLVLTLLNRRHPRRREQARDSN